MCRRCAAGLPHNSARSCRTGASADRLG
jgi:ribosomal protein L40E